ncbi:MAG: hypothetical protein A2Y65_08945 [Deltaproteobacteria bacterium RBG_13_52_11]|nr:MAG: hypothetical protein A2Y65_08945 [Deltaproteobacteria bacterium RBG_13_52_11]
MEKKMTGIFFHPLMAEGDCLERPGVTLSIPEPVQEGLLLKVHTPSLLTREKDAWYYEGALRTAGRAPMWQNRFSQRLSEF